MKVLWFTNTPCGAAEHLKRNTVKGGWLLSLENQLKKDDRVELSVAFFNEGQVEPFKADGVNYYPIARKKSTKYTRYLERIKNFVETEEYLQDFTKIIQEAQPDIIHVHGTEFSFGIITETIKEIPVVVSIQGNLTVYSNFYFRGFNKSTVFRYDNLKDRLMFVDQFYEYRKISKQAKLERRILSQTPYVFGRTDWDHDVTRVLAPNSQYREVNEVLRKPFYDTRWKKENFGKKRILTITGANLYKGIEMAFKTCKLLTEKKLLDFTWQIAGVKRSDHIVDICIKKYKVKPEDINLDLLGLLNEDELIEKMTSSSLYVQNSHIENSPNSLCEAMMVGLPILASTAGGSLSLLTHRKEGWLFQDGDEVALAGGIIRVLNKPVEEITTISENAHKRAMERHDPKRISDTLVDNYTDIQKNHLQRDEKSV